MDKLERHINLIALLLNSRRPLAAAEIRRKIPGYEGQSDDTFHRMFERDKTEIRELGITLEQADTPDGEIGYQIPQHEGMLDDPGLAADEMAALSLAAQSWGEGGEGSLGVLKLSVGTGSADPGPTGWLLPRVTIDHDIAALMDAVQRRKVVRFSYRTGGGAEAHDREVEPHGLYHRGDWYLTGFDRAREAVRHFKLARVSGKIAVASGAAPDFESPPRAEHAIPHGPWEGEDTIDARVAFGPDVVWWVERRTRARRVLERDDGWVELEMPCADIHPFAGWVAGFAGDAEVLEPQELRDAVIAHLHAAGAD